MSHMSRDLNIFVLKKLLVFNTSEVSFDEMRYMNQLFYLRSYGLTRLAYLLTYLLDMVLNPTLTQANLPVRTDLLA